MILKALNYQINKKRTWFWFDIMTIYIFYNSAKKHFRRKNYSMFHSHFKQIFKQIKFAFWGRKYGLSSKIQSGSFEKRY